MGSWVTLARPYRQQTLIEGVFSGLSTSTEADSASSDLGLKAGEVERFDEDIALRFAGKQISFMCSQIKHNVL